MSLSYSIPSHCELGVMLERAVMLVFAPITLPFKYKTIVQDADDFWVEYCADCALRSEICKTSGALGNRSCVLRHIVGSKTLVQTVQMPVPRHVLFFGMYSETLKFAYESPNGILYAMRLSNIYSDGNWCSGGVEYNGADPTSIYNGYFNSIHNGHLSPSDYPQFIEGLVKGTRTMDYDSYMFDPQQRWGSRQDVVVTPSKIEWSETPEQGFFELGYQTYAKIS